MLHYDHEKHKRLESSIGHTIPLRSIEFDTLYWKPEFKPYLRELFDKVNTPTGVARNELIALISQHCEEPILTELVDEYEQFLTKLRASHEERVGTFVGSDANLTCPSDLKCNLCNSLTCSCRLEMWDELCSFILEFLTRTDKPQKDVTSGTIKFYYECLFYYMRKGWIHAALTACGFTTKHHDYWNISRKIFKRFDEARGNSTRNYWRHDPLREPERSLANHTNYTNHTQYLRDIIKCHELKCPNHFRTDVAWHRKECNAPYWIERDNKLVKISRIEHWKLLDRYSKAEALAWTDTDILDELERTYWRTPEERRHEKQRMQGLIQGRAQERVNNPAYRKVLHRSDLPDVYTMKQDCSWSVCYYCEQSTATSIDHVLPISAYNKWPNYDWPKHLLILVPACKSCNSTARDMLFPTLADKKEVILIRRQATHIQKVLEKLDMNRLTLEEAKKQLGLE